VPGTLNLVGIGVVAVPVPVPVVGHRDFPVLHRSPFVFEDLFSGFAPVGCGNHRGPVPELEGKAGSLEVDLGVGIAGREVVGIGRRIDPLQEIGRSIAHLGEDPGAVLDVGNGGIGAILVHEILDGHRAVAGAFACAEKGRGGFHPGCVTAAPGVVAVRRRQDKRRMAGVVGMRRNVAANHADLRPGVAGFVAQHVVGRDRYHRLFRAGCRIDIFDLVQLIGEGRYIPGCIAGVGRGIPPAGGERRAEQVRPVGRAGIDAVVAAGRALLEIGWTGPTQMVAGHDDPLVAFIRQHVNHLRGKGHFGREKPLGMVGQIAVLAPRLPPGLLEDLDFLAQYRLGNDRRQGVMVGHPDRVQAGAAARGLPTHRFAIAAKPLGAVAEIVGAPEAAHVLDQRTGIADGIARALGQTGQRITRTALIGRDTVVVAENIGQIVVGMADAGAVGLRGFQDDGILGELHAVEFGPVAVPFRPVDRLMVVPKARNAHLRGLGHWGG